MTAPAMSRRSSKVLNKGDLVGLGAHLHLAQHRAISMVIGGEQVPAVLFAVATAA
jgi:hypothetical protein